MDSINSCCPLSWKVHKIKRVLRSTIAAEALSLQEGLEFSYYYRKIVEDITGVQPRTIPIVAYTDNKSVIEALHSTKLVDDKRLRELQYKNHCRQMTLGKLNGVLEINS